MTWRADLDTAEVRLGNHPVVHVPVDGVADRARQVAERSTADVDALLIDAAQDAPRKPVEIPYVAQVALRDALHDVARHLLFGICTCALPEVIGMQVVLQGTAKGGACCVPHGRQLTSTPDSS